MLLSFLYNSIYTNLLINNIDGENLPSEFFKFVDERDSNKFKFNVDLLIKENYLEKFESFLFKSIDLNDSLT